MNHFMFLFLLVSIYMIYNEYDKAKTAEEIAQFFIELDEKKKDK